MQTGIADSSMNSIMASAMDAFLAVETHDEACRGRTFQRHKSCECSRQYFGGCSASSSSRPRLRGSGLSIPTKTAKKLASAIIFMSAASSARLTESLGRELKRIVVAARCHAASSGMNPLSAFLLPIKIIVDEVEMAAITQIVQGVELGEHLRRRLWCAAPVRKAQ